MLQDLDEGTEMLEVGGNQVFGALSVGVVGGARVVERKVDVTLTLETIRDALDFLQNLDAITFVTFCLEIIERSEFCFHRLAALAPNDRVNGLQITIKVVSARAISRHLLFPDSDNKPVGFRNFEFRGLRNFGFDEVFGKGNHVARVLELLGNVFSEGFYGLREMLLVFAFVETLENVAVHLFGIALKSRANTGCSGCAAAVSVSATAATALSASSSNATSTGSTATEDNRRRCNSITHDGVSWVQKKLDQKERCFRKALRKRSSFLFD